MSYERKPRPMPRFFAMTEEDRQRFANLAEKASYSGNPAHKKNPGDFGLTPPAAPRPAKSLCDAAKIFERRETTRLLKEGLRRGFVSEQQDRGWPKAIWAVSDDGVVLEARLDNAEKGSYHGYPLPCTDPLASEIIMRWNDAHG